MHSLFDRFMIGPDQLICFPGNLELDAGFVGATSYLWSDGSDLQTLIVDTEGIYEVEVTNGFCVGTDDIFIAVEELEVNFEIMDTVVSLAKVSSDVDI